jgi:hypothetical protein
MKKYKTSEDIVVQISEVINSLEKSFVIINKLDEKSAHLLIESINKLKKLTAMREETSIHPASEEFANKYRDVCEKVGGILDNQDLFFNLMICDPKGKNTITYCHMSETQMIQSLVGPMMESPHVARKVLKGIGLPDIIVDPFIEISKRLKKERRKKK